MQRENEWGQPIGPELPGWKAPPEPSRRVLEGSYCRLEPLDVEVHGRSLFLANAEAKDARAWTYLPYGPFDTLESYRAWLRDSCLGDDPLFFAIVERESRAAAGVAAYLRIAPSAGSVEVGHLNFSPRISQSRAATEAMALMMKYAFELGYRRYEWKCDSLNAPSRAAALRLGFVFEGIFRNAVVYKGRSRDTAWFSVTDAEWPALARAHATWLEPTNFDEHGTQRTRLSELTRVAR